MQGVHAEIRTLFAQSAQRYIVASRISQSQDDFVNSSPEEREDIEVRWISEKEKMKGFYLWKQKEKGKAREDSPSSSAHGSVITEQIVGNEPPKTGWLNTRHLSFDERRKLQDQKKAWKKKRAEAAATGGTFIEEPPTTHTPRDDQNFEEAILTAVRETSRGDAVEDSRVEQAIRSSVRLLRSRSTTISSLASTFSHASSAQDSGYMSMTDLRRPLPNYDIKQPVTGPALPPRMPDDLNITDEEYQALIEQAVQLSIAEGQVSGVQRHDVDSSDDEDYKRALVRSQTERSGGDEDDEDYKKAIQASEAERGSLDEEEELRKAIEASQMEQTQGVTDDEELRRAIEESEKEHKEQLARASSLKTEEDIVLEYVKKQSLAEEEFRKAKGKQADTADEDEELRRALEESMRTESGVSRGGGGGPSQF